MVEPGLKVEYDEANGIEKQATRKAES